MGTNYYYDYPTERGPCEYCGRSDPTTTLHIGKSSAGWYFSMRIHPKYDIHGLESWMSLWNEGGRIYDEYGNTLSSDYMHKIITDRSGDKSRFHTTPWNFLAGYKSWDDFHRINHSEFGEHGLIRFRHRATEPESLVAEHLPICHGQVWSYFDKEFS